MTITTDSAVGDIALANTRLSDEQRALGPGDFWVRFIPQDHFVLFGHVLTEGEITLGEWNAGNPPSEIRQLLRAVRDNLKAGFLFSTVHSIWDVDGLIRMFHRSTVYPISSQHFREAQVVRFMPGAISGRYGWLRDAYRASAELALF